MARDFSTPKPSIEATTPSLDACIDANRARNDRGFDSAPPDALPGAAERFDNTRANKLPASGSGQ